MTTTPMNDHTRSAIDISIGSLGTLASWHLTDVSTLGAICAGFATAAFMAVRTCHLLSHWLAARKLRKEK